VALTDRRPGTLLRVAFRAPLPLYHLGLGWLFGRRLLLLAHRGRSSGARRETVLEVVRYDPGRREATVVAAWGERAQWYRNLRHAPALEVRIGRERWPSPRQRFLDQAETTTLLDRYRRQHPLAARGLSRVLGWPLVGTAAQRRALARSVRGVAFRPADR
jgi:deazaflavin-dependent oxidoreductase (nitroreductase family)